MKKFDYQFVQCICEHPVDDEYVIDKLKLLGLQGWELVSVTSDNTFILKRELYTYQEPA